jgi:hypothetical protein
MVVCVVQKVTGAFSCPMTAGALKTVLAAAPATAADWTNRRRLIDRPNTFV